MLTSSCGSHRSVSPEQCLCEQCPCGLGATLPPNTLAAASILWCLSMGPLPPLLLCCFLPSSRHVFWGIAAMLLQVVAAVILWCLPNFLLAPQHISRPSWLFTGCLAASTPGSMHTWQHAHLAACTPGSRSQSGTLQVLGCLAVCIELHGCLSPGLGSPIRGQLSPAFRPRAVLLPLCRPARAQPCSNPTLPPLPPAGLRAGAGPAPRPRPEGQLRARVTGHHLQARLGGVHGAVLWACSLCHHPPLMGSARGVLGLASPCAGTGGWQLSSGPVQVALLSGWLSAW